MQRRAAWTTGLSTVMAGRSSSRPRFDPSSARSSMSSATPARSVSPYASSGLVAAWKRHGRVANPDVLRIYLETVLHIGFDTAQAAATVSESLADTAALGARLDALDAPALEEAVERVAANPTCPADQVESALAGLLNARGRLPAGQTNRFEVPAAAKRTQAAARLLRGW